MKSPLPVRPPHRGIASTFGEVFACDLYTAVPRSLDRVLLHLGASRRRRDVVVALLSLRRRGATEVEVGGREVASRVYGGCRQHCSAELASMVRDGWVTLLRRGRTGHAPGLYDVSPLVDLLKKTLVELDAASPEPASEDEMDDLFDM